MMLLIWTTSAVASVINIAGNMIVATTSVGEMPSFAVAHPAGTRVYITHDIAGGNFGLVIATATNTASDTIPVSGRDPEDVAVRTDGKLRQRLSRIVRDTLSCSKKLANHIGAI